MSEGADGVFHVQVSNGFSQIFSPERAIHASLAILLAVCTFFASLRVYLCDVQVYQTANGIEANYDTLVHLLESIEHFLRRIDIYTQIPHTTALDKMVIKIIMELLSAHSLGTEGLKQEQSSEPILVEM
jgi:hypothetical protein